MYVHSNTAYGALASYRFMLTPSSALEANYGITYQNKINFSGGQLGYYGLTVLTRNQEVSGAFVHSFNFKKFNPFVEAGGGAFIFLPILNSGTTTHFTKQQTQMGALYGAGIAYEISPSFDIIVTRVPTFGETLFVTNKWYNIYDPVLGVAYHF